MTWNFDISEMPRDGQKIWVETAKGQVLTSRFAEQSKHNRKGGFINIGSEADIVAWQPYEVPAAIGIGRRLPVTKQSFDFNHAIDVGSGQ